MSDHATSPLGEKIQLLRQARGLTQQQLANKGEVSLSTVSKLEEGAVTRPSARVLSKLVKVLNFDLDELLSERPLPRHLVKLAQTPTDKPTIKFVYCDIGGVLLHTETTLLQALSLIYNRPIDKLRALYHQYVPIACKGKLNLEDLQVLMLLKLNIKYKYQQKAKLFKPWVDYYEAIEPMQQLLVDIAQQYPVGLLTDTVDGFVERMQQLKLLPALDYRVIVKSSDLGVIKPDPEIYRIAAERAKTPASQILFIDDKKINVAGARAAGWQAEWFNEFKPQASVERIRRKYL